MAFGAYCYEVVGVERDRCISYVARRNLFYMMYDVRVWSRAYAAHIEVPLQDEGANLFPLCRALKCLRVIFRHIVYLLSIYIPLSVFLCSVYLVPAEPLIWSIQMIPSYFSFRDDRNIGDR